MHSNGGLRVHAPFQGPHPDLRICGSELPDGVFFMHCICMRL